MKKLLLLPILAFTVLTAHAQQLLKASIVRQKNDEMFSCYLISADKRVLKFSLSEDGSGATTINRSEIKDISIQEPPGWDVVQSQFLRGQYDLALPALEKFATTYEGLVGLENSVGALSRYYQMVALVKVGRFRDLPALYAKVQYAPPALGSAYAPQMSVMPAWVEAGKANWPAVQAAVAKFEVKGETGPSAPSFDQSLSNELLSQLSMLRAVAHDQQGQSVAALNDYGRAMTLDVGANAWVTKSALGASLRIVDKLIKAEGANPSIDLLNEAHGLAIVLRDQYGEASVPAAQRSYFTPPIDPNEAPPAKSETKAPATK